MKTVIDILTASTVEEMIDHLKQLTLVDPSTIYVEGPNGNPLRLILEEQILSDNSVVYNIIIREARS